MPGKMNNPFGHADEVLSLDEAEKAELEGGEQQAADGDEAALVKDTKAAEQDTGESQQQPAEQGGKGGEYIPRARFNEVNERMKAAETERNELREQWARYDERFKQMQESREAVARAAAEGRREERPDPALDPTGAELYDLKQQVSGLVARDQQNQAQLSTFQQAQEMEQTNNWIIQDVARFKADKPDYLQAANHAVQSRLDIWKQAGYSDEQAAQIVRTEALAVANQLRKSGKSIAEWVYGLAGRLGYAGDGGAAAPAGDGTANGSAPGLVRRPGPTVTQLQRGQRATGIGNMGGTDRGNATGFRDLNPSRVAKMTEREWSAMIANRKSLDEAAEAMSVMEGVTKEEAMQALRPR